MYKIKTTEEELARECYSYRNGTENWYIARAFRKRGIHAKFSMYKTMPDKLPSPAIAGVKLYAEFGHFITILSEQDNVYVIGDPLEGWREYTKQQLLDEYDFTGFFIVFEQ